MLPIQLMLDSGAFNAYSRNIELDINKYIAFVKRHHKLLYSFVNMDRLPGVKGQRRTPAQIVYSAQQSYRNLRIMRDAGLSPIPVYHQNEALDFLRQMLDDGETYIGFSRNMAKKSQHRTTHHWFNESFALVKKYKNVRIHGFGITHDKLLMRYPWFSADSTAWIIQSAYGHVFMPRYLHDGAWDYAAPQRLKVSTRESGSSYRPAGLMGATELDVLNRYLTEIGTSLVAVCNSTEARQYANLKFFLGVQNQLKIKIFQAMNTSHIRILNRAGANNRLLSFFDLMDVKPGELARFVNGEHAEREPRAQKVDWSKQAYLNRRYVAFIERMKDNANAAE